MKPSRGWWGNAFRAVPLISSSFVARSTIPLLQPATININCVSNFGFYVCKWWANVRNRCCLSGSFREKRLQVTLFLLFLCCLRIPVANRLLSFLPLSFPIVVADVYTTGFWSTWEECIHHLSPLHPQITLLVINEINSSFKIEDLILYIIVQGMKLYDQKVSD